ncbi:MAG TPA: ABC transporter substrate-binding protein [Casimicrobiaceae bacterium]|jgi:putative ABC transport system substrate-binding protein
MNRRDAVVALVALGAAAGSRATSAQQPGRIWRVGYLALGEAALNSDTSGAFVKGMRDLGYVEGKNLVVEWRFADGKFERLPDMAADLVRLKVDVIVAVASAAIGAAQKATTTIPIVMAVTGDPVGSGFVKSLARPGGNITGLSSMGGETGGKHVELLLSVFPKLSRVGVLVTPTSPTYRAIAENVQGAAQQAGIKTVVVEASTPEEIESAFARLVRENAGAVIVGAAPLFAGQRKQIADLTVKFRLPSMFGNRSNVEAGGLMSFGGIRSENYLRSAIYVDKILKGAKPGDLAVEQPTQFEFVINLRTAKALGVTIPQAILLRAEVIQ